ncbi:hypothetical protein EV178_000847 [Coemansia sp. RSA 1646]|nr:hypothetical protein EV178_000847 [Coemansia sp. RSA 1646]
MIPSLSLFLGRSSQKQHSSLFSGSTVKPAAPHLGFSLLFEDIKTRDSESATSCRASPINKGTTTSSRPYTSSNPDPLRKMDDDQDANRTFAIVKPDALTPFKYQQIDALIKLNEFSIARQKLVWLSEELADALFPEKTSDPSRQEWLDYITGAPSLALELEKVNAPLFWQITMGAEDPGEVGGSDTDSIRGILAVDRIRNAVDGSQEPEDAANHLALIFSDKVPALPYDNFLMERAEDAHSTLAILKPDISGNEADVSQVIRRIVARGYTIKDRIDITLSRAQAHTFYAEHQGKPFFEGLVDFMTSGPVIALSLEGDDVIRGWRMMIGQTDPDVARAQAPQSIRALFGSNSARNAAHGSESPESARRELTFFFFPRIQPEEDSLMAEAETPVVPTESIAANDSIVQNGDHVPVTDASGTPDTTTTPCPATGDKKKKKQKKRRSKRRQTTTSNSAGPAADLSFARDAAHVSDESDEEKTLESTQSSLDQTEGDAAQNAKGIEDRAEDKPASAVTEENAASEPVLHPEAPASGNVDSCPVMELALPSDPANERTFGLIKPDAYPRYRKQLVKHILDNGLAVIAQEEVVLTRDAAERIYDGLKEFPVFSRVIDFVTSGPILVLVLEGHNAVVNWRSLVGPIHPRTAKFEARNSLRAKYGQDAQKNAVHASKDLQEAQYSIKAVFYDLLGGEFNILQSTDDPLAVVFPAEKSSALDVPDQKIKAPDSERTPEMSTVQAIVNPTEPAPEQTVEQKNDKATNDEFIASVQKPEVESNTAASNGNAVNEGHVETEAPDTVGTAPDETHVALETEKSLAETLESLSVDDVESTAAAKEMQKAEPNGAEPTVVNEDSANKTDSKDDNKSLTASSTTSPQSRTTPTSEKQSTFGGRLASSPFLKADRQLANDPASSPKRVGRIKSPFLGNERQEPVASSPSSTASKSVRLSPLTSGADVDAAPEDKPKDEAVVNDEAKVDSIDVKGGNVSNDVSSVCEKMDGLGIVSSAPKDEKSDEAECKDVAKPDAKPDCKVEASAEQEAPAKKDTTAEPQKMSDKQPKEIPKDSGDKDKPTQSTKPAKDAAKATPTAAAGNRPPQRSLSTRAPTQPAQRPQPAASSAQGAARRTSTLGRSAKPLSSTAAPAAASAARGSRRTTLGGSSSMAAASAPTTTRPTKATQTTSSVTTKPAPRIARAVPSVSLSASGPSAKMPGSSGSTSLSANSSVSTTARPRAVATQSSSAKAPVPARQPSVPSCTRAALSATRTKETDDSASAGPASRRVLATRTVAPTQTPTSSAPTRPRVAPPPPAAAAAAATLNTANRRTAAAGSVSTTKAPGSSVAPRRVVAQDSATASCPRIAPTRPSAAAKPNAASSHTATAVRPTLTRPVAPSMSVVSTASSRARAAKAAEARAAEAKAAGAKTAGVARSATRPLTRPITRPVARTPSSAGSVARRTAANGARVTTSTKAEEEQPSAAAQTESKDDVSPSVKDNDNAAKANS